ncbi:hypothetical protein [Bradyrhizobium sp. WSM471]|uniref:hypothetical protein n=1 Tax=Bradyrhizobium sp. WSM471 TaxID=319017 RepID=UPI00024D1A0E|nr:MULTISPECIES: hypothetical protein [Bradyrhizobium]EHR00183.1 hypothetical protein Bra471DRAFT_00727 [Bradyrhizobium sp. WSM471]UFW42304.1 hypothetical protein BcanWSM471_03590 [Bradyrhizobium canariense]
MKNMQTYTAYIPVHCIDQDDHVLARGLSASEAMKLACSHGDAWKIRLEQNDYGSFTHYVSTVSPDKRPAERSWSEQLHATVIRTTDGVADEAMALEMIAAQFLRLSHLYWNGKINSDEQFDKRVRRVKEAREVRRIDREIATKLIDAFIGDGFTITCDIQDIEPEFERCSDRDAILEYMWQIQIVEMSVHKNEFKGWLRLIFDEAGWDLVQEYSVGLEHIIDPICEPYLPWNQPNADDFDHGIHMLVLNSPDDVLKIEEMLK